MAEPMPEVLSLRVRRQIETRQLIEQVAAELFESKGFKATTVEEIAREAGIASRTFFRYYTSKDDVLFGWLEDVAAIVEAVQLRGGSAREVLENLESSLYEALAEVVGSPLVRRESYLRFRRLLAKDAELRVTLLMRTEWICDALKQRVLDHLGQDADVLTARLVLELAMAPMVAAVDSWAATEGDDQEDPGHGLLACYRRALVERQELLADA